MSVLVYRMIPGVIVMAASVAYMAPSKGPALEYDEPRDLVAARLMDSHRLVEGTGMGSLTIRNAYWHDGRLVVPVNAARARRSVNCKVFLSEDDPESTRAEVDCSGPMVEDSPRGAIAVQVMENIVGEHVDATMNRRDFDYESVYDRNMSSMMGS